MTLNILTTIKNYDELLRKVKRSLCSQNRVAQNMAIKNAVWALSARRKRTVNTLQQLLAHRRSVMNAIKTLWERLVDTVGTL